MLEGEYGPGTQKAMALLVRYGEVCGADRLVPASSVHVTLDGPYSFLAEILEGARARTFVSIHAPFDDDRTARELGAS